MKTGIVGPFPPYRGGIAQFSDRLVKTLRRTFPEDEFLPVSYRRLYPSLLFPGTSQYEPGSAGKAAFRDALIDPCSPMAWIRARHHIENAGFDRLIVQWWHPFFAVSLALSLPDRIPSAALCHNVVPHEFFPLAGRLAQWFLSRMSLLVTHSESDSRKAEALGTDSRLLRLYHPVYDQYVDPGVTREKAREKLGYSEHARLVLFFGLVRSYKGVQDLVRAMKLLPDDVLLLIVGEAYSERSEIINAISSLGLSDRVRWIDRFVPDDEVPLYFSSADVVALPYRHATQSGVAQIALSFGSVLVLTDTGGLSELVDPGSTGFLARPWCPTDLAESIASALELRKDPETSGRILRKADSFSWDNYARRLMDSLR